MQQENNTIAKTWGQMKAEVECQMDRDPQRATLSTRAWQQVEEGLRHLTGIGYNFEIAPKGTLGALNELTQPELELPLGNPLTIGATQSLLRSPKDPVNREFEALTGSAPHA